MREVGAGQPMRHGLAQHAALVRLVERPRVVGRRALAGDHQHVPIAFALRRFEEPPQRRVRIPLPHAMQVEPRLDRQAPAFELPRRLPVERLAARRGSPLRHRLRRRLRRGRWLLGGGLARGLGAATGAAAALPFLSGRALRATRAHSSASVSRSVSRLPMAASIAQAALTVGKQHAEPRRLLGACRQWRRPRRPSPNRCRRAPCP